MIVTGGLKKRNDSPGTLVADWAFVRGVIQGLSNLEDKPATHIETMLPSKEKDWPENLIRFEEGHVIRLQNRNSQSRRFSMVNSCDLDLANQHIIMYSDDFEKLAVRLRESLGVVFGK